MAVDPNVTRKATSICEDDQVISDVEAEPLLKNLVPEDAKIEKRRIMKNVILVSVAFFLNFNSFTGLTRLQSSINGKMGVVAMSFVHFARIPSCLILPNIIIGFLRHRWTMALGFSLYMVWMAANGYAVWGTLVPASALVGVSSSFTWTAVSSYLSVSAGRYAKFAGESQSTVISHFFGIFFFMYNLSGMTGAAISSAVLPAPKSQVTQTALELCGVNDCPWNNATINPNEKAPDSTTLWILVGIYLGIAFFAVAIVVLFVDSLPKNNTPEEAACEKALKLLVGTSKHLCNRKQMLLIPVTIYVGMSQASFNAEITKSFVTCALGIYKVGLVVMAYAFVNSVVCLTSGRIVKYTGRMPIVAFGFITDIIVLVFLTNWEPNPDQEYLFYIAAALWGIKEAILLTQINALYGSTFPECTDPAYAAYRMFESIGYALAYNYSSFVCTSVKLYILAGCLCAAIISYFTVENWTRFSKNKNVESQ